MAKSTKYLSGLFFTLAVNGGGGREGKWNKNNKSGGACCSTHYWQIRCVCMCVCVCPSRAAGVTFSRGGVLYKLPGPLNPSLIECKKKKKFEGRERGKRKWQRERSPLQLSPTTPSYLLVSHAVGQRGKREPPKKKRKKTGSVIPCSQKEKERVREGKLQKANEN